MNLIELNLDFKNSCLYGFITPRITGYKGICLIYWAALQFGLNYSTFFRMPARHVIALVTPSVVQINFRKQDQAQEKLPLGVGVDTVVIFLVAMGEYIIIMDSIQNQLRALMLRDNDSVNAKRFFA